MTTTDNPKQLTRDEVQAMYRDRRYAEIEQARKDGRLDNLLGIDHAKENQE